MHSMHLHHGFGSSSNTLKIPLKFCEKSHFMSGYFALHHAHYLLWTYSFDNALKLSRRRQ